MKVLILLTFLLLQQARASDALILQAHSAYKQGDLNKVLTLRKQVENHPLAAYVHFWAFKLANYHSYSDAEVVAISKQFPNSPLVPRIRAEWASFLANQNAWDRFAIFAKDNNSDDDDFLCQQQRFQLQQKQPTRIVPGIWAERFSEACARAFVGLMQAGLLSQDEARIRLRIAATENSAWSAVNLLQEEMTLGHLEQLEKAHRLSTQVLAKPGDLSKQGAREVALYALAKQARSNPQNAASLWQGIARHFGKEEQSYAHLLLGTALSKRLDNEALNYFKQVKTTSVLDSQAAWWARAAMRVNDWSELARAISAMSPEAQNDPTWTYWKGRALSGQKQNEAAQSEWQKIKNGFGFYHWLAAESLGTAPAMNTINFSPTKEQLAKFDPIPGAQRAVKLTELGLRFEAAREWFEVIKNLSDQEQLAASHWMMSKGIYDRAIGAAERTKNDHDLSLRYQNPYASALNAAAKNETLEPALVAALSRQESRFAADIVSSAGAVGLMQLMPNTARWVAKQLGKTYSKEQLIIPEQNAIYGTYYLRTITQGLHGSYVLGLAAYNAGPGRAKAWQGERSIEGAAYAESIPFNETRDYVKKVLVGAMWINSLNNKITPSLRERLGMIPARGGSSLSDDTP
jgi:soluble lytic murein transglycosylase